MELTANQMGDIIFQAFFLNTASRSGNEELFYLLSTCIKTEKITANNSIFNISYLSYAKMFLNFDDLEKVYPEICLFFPENANSDISYDDNYKAKIIKSIEEGYLTEPRQGYIWVGTGEDNASIYVKEFIGGYPRLIIRNELERSFIEEFNRKLKSIDISNFEIKKKGLIVHRNIFRD